MKVTPIFRVVISPEIFTVSPPLYEDLSVCIEISEGISCSTITSKDLVLSGIGWNFHSL